MNIVATVDIEGLSKSEMTQTKIRIRKIAIICVCLTVGMLITSGVLATILSWYRTSDFGVRYTLDNEVLIECPRQKRCLFIANRVKTIGSRACYGCESLELVTFPNSVMKIDELAFFDCSSLELVWLPEGVTTIENKAFSGCSSLKSIKIPRSVTKIGMGAFAGCDSLKSVTVNLYDTERVKAMMRNAGVNVSTIVFYETIM